MRQFFRHEFIRIKNSTYFLVIAFYNADNMKWIKPETVVRKQLQILKQREILLSMTL